METKIKPIAPAGGIHRQILVAVLASIPALEYGQMIAWVSASLRLLQSPDTPASAPLSDLIISVIASVVSFGAAIGTPFFSYATDRFGRKPAIMMISLLYAFSWTLKLISPEAPSVIAARAIAGFASGGLFVVVPIYVREISQDSVRGAIGVIVMSAYNIGVMAIYTQGIYLSHYVSLSVCLGTSMTHLGLFLLMPETPVFCVKKKRYEEAAKNLAWLRNKDRSDEQVIAEIERLKNSELQYQESPRLSIFKIVQDKPTFRALRLAILILFVQPLSGNFAIVSFSTSIFQRANTEWSPEHLGLFVAATQLCGSFVSINTIEKCGRKPLLIFSMFMISCCMGTIATWFLLDSYNMSVPGWIPVAAVCGSIFSYGVGLASLPGIIMAEIFNFQYRARLAGICIVLSWSVSAFVLLSFMPLANTLGASACFYTYCACALLGVAHVALNMPETRGKSYEEIECEFHRKEKCEK